ncbi:SAM-dependent methyltransferase, partial [Mangrovihabitans endophyticus]|uniref:SAM-dependent methyltransferase n=1 Tax=Mangrovihabitans endophyticus TaxID=1751298 RepID=UPI001665D8BC
AHPARRYDYWLGGKDNFAADRASGDAIEQVFPHIRTAARENRRFLHRAVKHLAAAGIRQFLDIGTGLPTADNTHQIAQTLDPTARIVYADNDPLVLVHARALLTSHPHGHTAYVHADLRNPDRLLADPDLAATLDLNQPVGLLLIAVLHFLPDPAAHTAVHTLVDALPAGSYLALSHATADLLPAGTAHALHEEPAAADIVLRTHTQISAFTTGLDLLPPGIT